MCQRIYRQFAFSPRKEKSEYEKKEKRDHQGLQRAGKVQPTWPTYHRCRSPGERNIKGSIVA